MAQDKDRKSKILSLIGKELKMNPPSILSETRKKKGKDAAEKQRVAILLAKARDRGVAV